MTVFASAEALCGANGRDLGWSDPVVVTAADVEAFARATGGSDAHADMVPPMLLLAVTNRLLPSLLRVDSSAGINYGTGAVRFLAPGRVGDSLRMHAALATAEPVAGGVQAVVQLTLEVTGSDGASTIACTVEAISRYVD